MHKDTVMEQTEKALYAYTCAAASNFKHRPTRKSSFQSSKNVLKYYAKLCLELCP